MSQSITAVESAQAYEILSAAMAKQQHNQEARLVAMLVDSAMLTVEQSQVTTPEGNLGQHIDINV